MHDHVPLWEAWNKALYLRLHATATSPHWLITAAAWLSEAPLFVALGLTAWRLVHRRDTEGAIRTMVAFGIALATEALVSALAFHPRPFAAGLGPAWVEHAANNSMPSTHVTLVWIMALTLALRCQRRVSLVLFLLGITLAWARIYVGIHWPADMVGAAFSAGISVLLAAVLLRLTRSLLGRRRGATGPRPHRVSPTPSNSSTDP